MDRFAVIACITSLVKSVVVPRKLDMELWLINDLIDDPAYRDVLKKYLGVEVQSVIALDYINANGVELSQVAGKEKYLELKFNNKDVYLNTDAIYGIAVDVSCLSQLNSRTPGAPWVVSPDGTQAFIDLSVPYLHQKYF